MPILYAVSNGTGATYHVGDAHLYEWFNNEQSAQQFARSGKFDLLHEGTIFRLDFGAVDDDLLCSLMTQSYESRVTISVIKAPPLQPR